MHLLGVGRDGARAHGVHADVVGAELARERARHAEQRALGGDVRHEVRPLAPERDAADVDHGAAAARAHRRGERLHEREGRVRVHPLDALVLLERVLGDRLERHHRGVVDETVEAIHLAIERQRLAAGAGEIREITFHEMHRRPRSFCVQRAGDGPTAFGVDVMDHHPRPRRPQPPRHGRAETPRASGDEHRASFHVHGYSIRTSVGTIAAWRCSVIGPPRSTLADPRMSADDAPTMNVSTPGSVTNRICGS